MYLSLEDSTFSPLRKAAGSGEGTSGHDITFGSPEHSKKHVLVLKRLKITGLEIRVVQYRCYFVKVVGGARVPPLFVSVSRAKVWGAIYNMVLDCLALVTCEPLFCSLI